MNPDEILPARELAAKEFNSLRGRLCSVIESANLPGSQEKALKVLIKQLSYQSQAVIIELIQNLDNDEEVQFQYVDRKVEIVN